MKVRNHESRTRPPSFFVIISNRPIRKRVSDSGPNDVSRAQRRQPVGTLPCLERERLRKTLDIIQKQLDQLVTEGFAAFEKNDPARFWSLKRELEPLHEERLRAEDALRKHIRSHRCQPPATPLP